MHKFLHTFQCKSYTSRNSVHNKVLHRTNPKRQSHPVQRTKNVLTSNANDTTSRTTTGVTGLLGLVVTTLTQVISTSVDDNGTAQDTLSAEQLHERVLLGARSVALGVGGEVTQVTDVTVGVFRGTVGLAVRVDYYH